MSLYRAKYYIPERFEKEIVLHSARILSAKLADAPVILAISGPPGFGKSFQCSLLLRSLGIKIFPLTASDFENKEAGEPAKLVKKTYDDAVAYLHKSSRNRAAILIDDADVAFGNWGPLVQYTVNTQEVIGELMRIANKPTNESDYRVPIYLTGNDLNKLYTPLKREGRMDFFYWEPEIDEKAKMVFYCLDSLSLSECHELINYVDQELVKRKLPASSVAFYSTLSAHLHDEIIWKDYLAYRNNNIFMNPLDGIHEMTHMTVPLEKLKELSLSFIVEMEKSRFDNSKPINMSSQTNSPMKG